MSVWKEIGKGILKNAATAYGTRVLVERVVPAAEGLGGRLTKKLKSSMKKDNEAENSEEKPSVSEEDAQKFKAAATRVASKPSKIVDADVE